ncbi:hypothetical protein [Kitasatospora sp. NPDC059673]|uniref:hypothetical protein n=1 Tax=Kitasatospora sp. NPDC059673 TaxID=3346901 RepID=UPI00368E03D7
MTTSEPGDDLWAEFVREIEKNNAVHEPSAAERAAAARRPVRRRSRRWLVLPAAAVLLAAAGATAYVLQPSGRKAPAAAASVPAAAAPAPAAGSVIPLDIFPKQVQGYTLVADVQNPTCTGADTVGTALAGMIAQGKGCLGVDLALYKDADGNQYTLALFTMKDPAEAVHLLTYLAGHPETFQVAVQLPPKDSGLRELPADSGLVQNFGSSGHGLLVGMAQWSDGRTTGFDKLVARLTPLTEAVMHNIPA